MSRTWNEKGHPRAKSGQFKNSYHAESDASLENTIDQIIVYPADDEALSAWNALLDLAGKDSTSWVLIGGQAVYLRAIQNQHPDPRRTNDIDIVLDARDHLAGVTRIPRMFKSLGFEVAGSGHSTQHRWLKNGVVLDVLEPRFLGERTNKILEKHGAKTIPAPGSRQVLDRSEVVRVLVGDRSEEFRCPTPLGLLIAKAGAYCGVLDDPNSGRHLLDILQTLPYVRPSELRDSPLTKLEKKRLRTVMAVLQQRDSLTDGDRARFERILSYSPPFSCSHSK